MDIETRELVRQLENTEGETAQRAAIAIRTHDRRISRLVWALERYEQANNGTTFIHAELMNECRKTKR